MNKNCAFEWGKEQMDAFKELETQYKKDFKLSKPNHNLDYYLETDTTHDNVNGVLYQIVDGQKKIILFVSKTLAKHQKNYTTIEKQMHAVTTCLKKLYLWLVGAKIHINQRMATIINKFRELAEIHRKAAVWITILNSFDIIFDVRTTDHAKIFDIQAPEITISQCVSEMLKTINVNNISLPEKLKLDFKNLKFHQSQDAQISKITNLVNSAGPKNKIHTKFKMMGPDNDKILHKIFADGTSLPYLPDVLFRDTIDYIHEFYNHTGANKLNTIFKRYFYIKNSKKHIQLLTNACLLCKMKFPTEVSEISGIFTLIRISSCERWHVAKGWVK